MTRTPPETEPRADLVNEIRRFLQSAVHDLRATQRRTGVSAELLVQATSDQDRAEWAAQVVQGLSKSEELLTAIGKYATALGSYSIAPFPAIVAVRFALANLEREIQETNATITIGDLPEISGDRDRVAELFEHLIGNSLKFRGPDAPSIQIAARSAPEGWVFSVTDNGVGIPAKYHDRLFVPFYRLHSADVPGGGLGLAICRKIADAHGGRIWIDHCQEPGVTVSFTLAPSDGGQRA